MQKSILGQGEKMKKDFSDELRLAMITAKKLGDIQKNYFRKKYRIIRKSKKELVSEVDMKCQLTAIKYLSKSHPIMAEEQRNHFEIEESTWIVDSLDASHNFVAGIQIFGTSIALVSKREFILGVIYLPYFEEMFTAIKGGGAFLNSKEISVSNNKNLSKSMVCYDNQFYLNSKSFGRYKRIIDNSFTTRVFGSAIYDLTSVARGVIDARIFNNTKPFDFASGKVIVEEAGGKVTDFQGKKINIDSKEIVVSNGKVHKMILKILKDEK